MKKKNKTRDQDVRERTSQTLRNLRGLNVTMVKAVEKPIVQQNGEEQEAAQKLKLDMSNIQTALNMMNTAKKDSVKRELEKESTDEENPPKTLKLDGNYLGQAEKVVEGDPEDYEGEAGVEAEYMEEEENDEENVVVEENEEENVVVEENGEEKVVVEENEEQDGEELEVDEKELKDEEEELAEEIEKGDDEKVEDGSGEGDPFWFCGPPSSVLVKREEERLAREKEEKEKFRLAREKEKLKSAMEMEETKLGNLKREETVEIKMKERYQEQEEGESDIIDEDECAPCFKGWVHFCPEDIFAC